MPRYPLFLTATFLFAAPAIAQQAAPETGEIVLTPQSRESYITVVANGLDERLDTTGQPVSIIDHDEIEDVQGADVTRVLQRVPGVTISRNGGIGSFTGVRIRGAEAEQLLVLIDGVRVADVASPGGGFDSGNLLTGSIGKMELLRGSNSTVWGSQAIGGVLAVTTIARSGVAASAEYGARGTLYAHADAGVSGDAGQISLTTGYYDSDGFSAAAVGTENDGFRQWHLGGRGRLNVADGFSLVASARYADGRLEIDGFPAPDYVFADTAEFQDTREISGAGGFSYLAGGIELQGTYSRSNVRRDSFDPQFGSAPTFATRGTNQRAELRGKSALGSGMAVRFGSEYEWSNFSTTYDARRNASAAGGYAQLGYDGGNGLVFNAGARVVDHSRFGSAVTFGGDAAIVLGDGWRVRASIGEGFKVPTLYQLFSDYGNRMLQPERSTSFDLGLDYGDRNLSTFLAVSLFRRDSENLIDFISCFGAAAVICTDRPFGTYDNVGLARAQGLEVEAGHGLGENIDARIAYALVDTENRTSGSANKGNELARRPRHAATVSADWQTPDSRLELGADVRLVSRSFDNAANSVRLDGFTTVDLRAQWQATRNFVLFGRIENVTDETYQTAAGYGAAGRGIFAGVRAAM